MSNRDQGVGLFTALGLIFITLKLTGVVGWSWWWVLSPFWGPTAIAVAIVIVFLSIAAIGQRVSTWGVDKK